MNHKCDIADLDLLHV